MKIEEIEIISPITVRTLKTRQYFEDGDVYDYKVIQELQNGKEIYREVIEVNQIIIEFK